MRPPGRRGGGEPGGRRNEVSEGAGYDMDYRAYQWWRRERRGEGQTYDSGRGGGRKAENADLETVSLPGRGGAWPA